MYRDNKRALTLCPIYYRVIYLYTYTIPVHVICCCRSVLCIPRSALNERGGKRTAAVCGNLRE